MNTDMMKAAGQVLGLILALPFAFACIKAALFFGSMEKTVQSLEETCKGFATVTKNHGERLVAVETHVEGIREQLGDRRTNVDRRVP